MSFPVSILFEDNHVIAVVKPAGVLSQGDETGDMDMVSRLKAFIRTRDRKPGNVFVGLVHRLDRPVSGVMVFAKTSKAASRISAAFRQRTVDKRYYAIVEGIPEGPSMLVHRLCRDRVHRITRVVDRGGKEARLMWKQVGTVSGGTVVEVELITGLPHQIRAQFAHLGHPVWGDKKYGSRQLVARRGILALHCHRMEVPHPVKETRIVVETPPESWWPWRVGSTSVTMKIARDN